MLELVNFAQLGVAGLAVFLMYKIASNHIDHNTKVLGELRDTLRTLIQFLEKRL